MLIDLSQNEKQATFFNEVMNAVNQKTENRFFFYGGAIRGGKTYVSLFILIALAKYYPKSRWHIIRDSFTTLEQTTIPSFEKLAPDKTQGVARYMRNKGNYHCEFTNGSKIFFVSENITHDPQLTWMAGLESNGIFLEQIDGLREDTFNKALERLGSWYIDPMPPALLLATFNPTQGWVKEKIYEQYKEGKLKTPYYYIEALPNDNPFVTSDQWDAWSNMDAVNYKKFVEGDWYAYSNEDLYLYCFDQDKHIGEVDFDDKGIIYLSFDFNVNPMTCLVSQHDKLKREIRVIKEYRLTNATVYDMCNRIKAEFNPARLKVTGDPRGTARNSIALSSNLNSFNIIREELRISMNQIDIPSKYPSPGEEHEMLRLVGNSILSKYPTLKINTKCSYLLNDCKYIGVNSKGKREKGKEGMNGHLLDCFLYYIYAYFNDFVNKV